MRKFIAALSLYLIATSAISATWDSSEDKGLKLYTADAGAVKASLVCDPDGLWEPAEFHLTVKENGVLLAGKTVTVTGQGTTVTVPLSGGAILSQDQEGWNKVMSMLSLSGPIDFATQGKTIQLVLDGNTSLDCVRDG